MAEVDFTNARISPEQSGKNPTGAPLVNIDTGVLTNASGNLVASGNHTVTKNTAQQFVILYSGTFDVSGTEFYLRSYGSSTACAWKVSNITFSAGDTYVFSIKADLICQ